jgi:putative endonuclease
MASPMASPTTVAVGAHWEKLAHEHLATRGLDLVERNFRCRIGEIDLIMLHLDCLVFVEVRYRAANRYSSATLSVTRHKQRKLAQTAAVFLGRHPQYSNYTMRFDVVAFDAVSNDQCTIQWLQDAFRPET